MGGRFSPDARNDGAVEHRRKAQTPSSTANAEHSVSLA